MEFMQYKTLLEVGEVLFDTNASQDSKQFMDGSLYAVVEGQVTCQFQLQQQNNNTPTNNSNEEPLAKPKLYRKTKP